MNNNPTTIGHVTNVFMPFLWFLLVKLWIRRGKYKKELEKNTYY